MTYHKISMRDPDTGYEWCESIRGETIESAIEEAKEIYPDRTGFKPAEEQKGGRLDKITISRSVSNSEEDCITISIRNGRHCKRLKGKNKDLIEIIESYELETSKYKKM